MARHGNKRTRPAELLPGTLRVLCFRMHYWHAEAASALSVLADPDKAYIARYALGRDYHRLMRKRLRKLAERIAGIAGPMGYRVFVDSAPVMEKPLAEQAGLGWMGKHTNLINRHEGSWFFLGEIYTDLPLPVGQPVQDHCGSCRACLDICPTQAIVAPLSARRSTLHLIPDNRASRPDSVGIAADDRQPGVRLRRLPIGVPVETATPAPAKNRRSPRAAVWTTQLSAPCSTGPRNNGAIAPAAAPCAGPAISGGCAIWRWRWATPRARRPSPRPYAAVHRTPANWCASTSAGRWIGTRNRAR